MILKYFLLFFLCFQLSSSSKIFDRTKNGQQRIVGGTPVAKNELPYQVSLQWMDPDWIFYCGASVLNEMWILTAAHCQVLLTDRAVAGEHRFSQDDGTEQVSYLQYTKRINKILFLKQCILQIRSIGRVINHPRYDDYTLDNDIALVQLASALDLSSPAVAPVKLPTYGVEPAVGALCITSGWGDLTDGGVSSDVLMKVTLPIISDIGIVR